MVKNISAEELRELIKSKGGDIEIIDVRQPEEYEESHIEGAKLIPLGELSERINEIDWNKEIIFMCRSGARSAVAANIAASLNKDCFNLEGGILAWQNLE
ncbi:MAG: rhodanese-like domain-containing protein [Patescibacteria group bacterium]|nr:rhodanese-like domain-containing protein [Patescibacteria group bacterium]